MYMYIEVEFILRANVMNLHAYTCIHVHVHCMYIQVKEHIYIYTFHDAWAYQRFCWCFLSRIALLSECNRILSPIAQPLYRPPGLARQLFH